MRSQFWKSQLFLAFGELRTGSIEDALFNNEDPSVTEAYQLSIFGT
jgi:hypothetical protein